MRMLENIWKLDHSNFERKLLLKMDNNYKLYLLLKILIYICQSKYIKIYKINDFFIFYTIFQFLSPF